MGFRVRFVIVLACLVFACTTSVLAPQNRQWVPGQFGLNAGVVPSPGITYANLALNHSASQLNNSNGNRIPGITGDLSFWVDENIFYYVPKHKFLCGYFMPYIALNLASGELVADITLEQHNLNGARGGSGFADTWVEPFILGWNFGKRVAFNAGYAFTAPTGRYNAGASNNVGSGYWGNNIMRRATLYLTKNQATTANFATDWEIHGQRTVASVGGAPRGFPPKPSLMQLCSQNRRY